MNINFNRLSKLAGLPADGGSKTLNEGKYSEMDELDGMDGMDEMADIAYMNEEDPADEGMDEIIEVDEAMLVQELRRAKRIMQENKRRAQLSESRKRQRKQKMFENQLKRVIDEEVQNVFNEMNITGDWVYGSTSKPRRSKNGYTHQGSFMPGIGFKR
jgi:hypothetical protein